MLFSLSSYLLASIAIGVTQIIDSIILLKNKRVVGVGAVIFSMFEYIWAGISFFVWRTSEGSFPRWFPLSFVLYVIAIFVLGLVFVVQNRGKATTLPNAVFLAGGVFGAYFAAVAAFYAVRG